MISVDFNRLLTISIDRNRYKMNQITTVGNAVPGVPKR
jgi:hypothetical protein